MASAYTIGSASPLHRAEEQESIEKGVHSSDIEERPDQGRDFIPLFQFVCFPLFATKQSWTLIEPTQETAFAIVMYFQQKPLIV